MSDLPTTIDLGCGPNKIAGAWGVDHHPYAGVDQVVDLDGSQWDLPADHFTVIHARQVIEHVADIPRFLNHIHRIAADGAMVHIVTPHFSSLTSWQDPTHRWHLSTGWHEIVTGAYLNEQIGRFEHRTTRVSFGSNPRCWIARLMIKLKGYTWWEKHFAFVYRGKDLFTDLQVIKNQPTD